MNGLNYLKNSLNKENYSYNIIIGPEGDFSEVELKKLEAIKPTTVSLGSRRLRSETSAIVGLANINQMLKYIDG
jgi:16S rRNA (uracil1498-N3)-methyltransferase